MFLILRYHVCQLSLTCIYANVYIHAIKWIHAKMAFHKPDSITQKLGLWNTIIIENSCFTWVNILHIPDDDSIYDCINQQNDPKIKEIEIIMFYRAAKEIVPMNPYTSNFIQSKVTSSKTKGCRWEDRLKEKKEKEVMVEIGKIRSINIFKSKKVHKLIQFITI